MIAAMIDIEDHVCRHCQIEPSSDDCGLCLGCQRIPGVRSLHKSILGRQAGRYSTRRQDYRSPIGRRSPRGLPAEPTDAQPGSEAKIRVLEERAAQGVALWHPLDAPLKDERR